MKQILVVLIGLMLVGVATGRLIPRAEPVNLDESSRPFRTALEPVREAVQRHQERTDPDYLHFRVRKRDVGWSSFVLAIVGGWFWRAKKVAAQKAIEGKV